MTYEELADFVQNRMRMSHIYQPVMLMALLENSGVCHQKDIAKVLLAHDESQIEYYTNITNSMVGSVLRNHRIVSKNSKTKNYSLEGFEFFSDDEVNHLIELCQIKLNEFLEKRGKQIFQHRKKSAGYISGTIRYEVLKRAKFRCELCGISADEKALEVDHILPRNKGGSDELFNLQALCYSCNAMKRDRDDTDFREVRESYAKREKDCLFCEIDNSRVIAQNELAYVTLDGFPVTELHSLVIPKRHALTYFELGQAELNACHQLLFEAKENIQTKDKTVTGFNIGMNNGESAGQTIFHCHIHLIPRRENDVKNPRGGVRNTIPGKADY